jgi:tRNA1Val (adenine37-N6)-methyltransferase
VRVEGTGLLALIAAQRNTKATIDAIDIDDASAEQAAANAAASPWSDRIRVHRMDVRRMKSAEPYDLIICNPPFYAGEMDSPDARKGLAKHSGELTFAELIDAVSHVIARDGRFACIIPMNREAELLKLAASADLHLLRRCALRYLEARPPKRVLLEFGPSTAMPQQEELVVEHTPGVFTDAYRALLSDLMLKF